MLDLTDQLALNTTDGVIQQRQSQGTLGERCGIKTTAIAGLRLEEHGLPGPSDPPAGRSREN